MDLDSLKSYSDFKMRSDSYCKRISDGEYYIYDIAANNIVLLSDIIEVDNNHGKILYDYCKSSDFLKNYIKITNINLEYNCNFIQKIKKEL